MGAIHAYGSDNPKDRILPGVARGELIGCFGLTEPDHGSDPSGMKAHAWRAGGGQIDGFVLERGMEGLTTPKIEGKFEHRASPTGEIFMDDVFVPEDNRLPAARGLSAPLSCLTRACFVISWGPGARSVLIVLIGLLFHAINDRYGL